MKREHRANRSHQEHTKVPLLVQVLSGASGLRIGRQSPETFKAEGAGISAAAFKCIATCVIIMKVIFKFDERERFISHFA
jgi:hypothetical protein